MSLPSITEPFPLGGLSAKFLWNEIKKSLIFFFFAILEARSVTSSDLKSNLNSSFISLNFSKLNSSLTIELIKPPDFNSLQAKILYKTPLSK